MARHHIFTDGKEVHCTTRPSAYGDPRWTKIGESSRPPKDGEAWNRDAGRWQVPDAEAQERRERAHQLRDHGHLRDIIDALERRLDKVEAALAGLKGKD